MDSLDQILLGFAVATQSANLLFCLLGVLLGTLIGVLPGLGPVATMSMLLPLTFYIQPAGAIIMLAGIFYGAMYGGSTTAVLVNIPGEVASIVTTLDGYQMARLGRAGPALGISAFGSFIAGILGMIFLIFLTPWLANFALRFGPPEFFSLMILGLSLVTYLAAGSKTKALMMVAFGFILGQVGADPTTGKVRFSFGLDVLANGLGIVPVVMGLFGVGEVFTNIEIQMKYQALEGRISRILPNLQDWKESLWPIIRGSIMGFFLGVLPGGGGALASFASYAVEKRVSRHPERFGKGAIAGVAGPESANNAGCIGSFVPLLALGFPTNAVMAVLLSSFVIQGIQPGPLLISENPDIFWGVIISMLAGNLFLLILNLPLIGIWIKLLKVPFSILFPLIILFCLIGVYVSSYDTRDLLVMLFFGLLGWGFRKYEFEPAPLVLAMILSPVTEISLAGSLIKSDGSFAIFFTRPISAVLMISGLLLITSPIFAWLIGKMVRQR